MTIQSAQKQWGAVRRAKSSRSRPLLCTAAPRTAALRTAALRTAAPRIAALISLSILVSGCASLSALSPGSSRSERAERPELSVEYDVLLAEIAYADGDLLTARNALRQAITKDPDSAYLEMRLSRIEAHFEDLMSAIAHADRAVELEPDNEEARTLLGGLFRLSQDVEGAESALLGDDVRHPRGSHELARLAYARRG